MKRKAENPHSWNTANCGPPASKVATATAGSRLSMALAPGFGIDLISYNSKIANFKAANLIKLICGASVPLEKRSS